MEEFKSERVFDVLTCTWPRPVKHLDGRWLCEPQWDAPLMPRAPRPRRVDWHTSGVYAVDWRAFFREDTYFAGLLTGHMRGFHVVFRIRVNVTGTLTFWGDDGCIVRRDGVEVHVDRGTHAFGDDAGRGTIEVRAGDVLEVAQWQNWGDWTWGARVSLPGTLADETSDRLAPYLPAVRDRLADPDGPALKTYLQGTSPARTVVALYSLLLNGFSPAEVVLYGEDQWPAGTRDLFAELLPFARVVPTGDVLDGLADQGWQQLARWAERHWFVMKAVVALLHGPEQFAMMDDDVFVLGPMADAVRLAQHHDLVYCADFNHSDWYASAWMTPSWATPPTRLNAGLYLARGVRPRVTLARHMLVCDPDRVPPYIWEQGFLTWAYADEARTVMLDERAYFYPLLDGLPGGFAGYDYAANPCGFTSIHFGGSYNKPDDPLSLLLAGDVLGPPPG